MSGHTSESAARATRRGRRGTGGGERGAKVSGDDYRPGRCTKCGEKNDDCGCPAVMPLPAVKAIAAKPAHPPVLPVGGLFEEDDPGEWFFRYSWHGTRYGVAVGDPIFGEPTPEFYCIIAALQRCAWLDAMNLPEDKLQALLIQAGVKFGASFEYHACQIAADAWAAWGKAVRSE